MARVARRGDAAAAQRRHDRDGHDARGPLLLPGVRAPDDDATRGVREGRRRLHRGVESGGTDRARARVALHRTAPRAPRLLRGQPHEPPAVAGSSSTSARTPRSATTSPRASPPRSRAAPRCSMPPADARSGPGRCRLRRMRFPRETASGTSDAWAALALAALALFATPACKAESKPDVVVIVMD